MKQELQRDLRPSSLTYVRPSPRGLPIIKPSSTQVFRRINLSMSLLSELRGKSPRRPFIQ
jgi:hypothetical protein